MNRFGLSAVLAFALASGAQAGEAGDLMREHLYAGTIAEGLEAVMPLVETGNPEASFAAGVLTLADGIEGFSQALYRYGATAPGFSVATFLFGMPEEAAPTPANPDPDQLTYEALRGILADFVGDLDAARTLLEAGGQAGDYVVMLDPALIQLDLTGDGVADQTLGAIIAPLLEPSAWSDPVPMPGSKTKDRPAAAPDTNVGFDRADALWLAGYSQVVAVHADVLLAHDFSDFYDVYLHQIFPKAGLPMQDYAVGGMLMIDVTTDAAIADIFAGIHNLDFPVTDAPRLAGVLARLQSITALSRQNWQAILLETDDNRELVPSPEQTSIVPGGVVTAETVDAWMATLDTADQILAGELLVPHWRFAKGFDLKAYFETATETDLVMLWTGFGALPFLRDGPIADAESFAEANRVFGENLIGYAFWFN